MLVQEETWKNQIARTYFPKFIYEPFGKIDFTLRNQNDEHHLLWAEAKKETADIFNSFTQLVLTIGVDQKNAIKPPFLAVFDFEKIAFIETHFLSDFYDSNKFNEISWNKITPSNYKAPEFEKMKSRIETIISEKAQRFYFESDEKDLNDFILNSLSKGEFNPIEIDADNFDFVYLKWREKVYKKGVINFNRLENFEKMRKEMTLLETDFFLADLISDGEKTLEENLRVLLQSKESGEHFYKIKPEIKGLAGMDLNYSIEIIKPELHLNFWKSYKRPPAEKFWTEIFNRRDKLAPSDIRERKGAFFTPAVWVKKAQEYLKDSLGENWENEYYIWDCAAGTGNLLVGLKNPARLFASTIDLNDVEMMKQIVKMEKESESENKLDLFEKHIFQFDFLNDSFEEKLPENLKRIIQNEPEKLVIFINPPYVEAGNTKHVTRTGANKIAVSNTSKVWAENQNLGLGIRETFAQFFIRIYKEIPGCVLASFSKLKYINATAFVPFRRIFLAQFLKGFICPSYTFDNVNGKFPIAFAIWNTSIQNKIKKIKFNVFDENNKKLKTKTIYSTNGDKKTITPWITKFKALGDALAYSGNNAPDFQNNRFLKIAASQHFLPNGSLNNATKYKITPTNLLPIFIYFSVRYVVKATWINDRDQFLFPNKKWEKDKEFQHNCFVYALFHGQNKISNKEGTNHFIPFTEKELNIKEAFESHFLLDFMAGKIKSTEKDILGENKESFIPTKPMEFSIEAQNVLNAAKALYIYYHQMAGDVGTAWKINDKTEYLPNAALYDIKEFFQGRNEKGRMNAKSEDLKYTELLNDLKNAQKILAQKIEPKIYEYEFLLE